jgi:hypothetical protein
MSKFIVAVVAALALSIGVGSMARAADETEYKKEYDEETKQYWQYKKVVTYKTIIEYKTIQQVYYKWVIEYDHCYKPYKVKKTFYRDVEVPVKKVIPIVTWVKVKVYEETNENGY